MRQIVFGIACVSAGLFVCRAAPAQAPDRVSGRDVGWPEYGGSLAGQRYSAAQEIDRGNVGRLQKAWTLDVRKYEGAKPRGSFEATPVLWQGTLYLATPKDVVLAVDAATGKVRWTFDPGVKDEDVHYIATSRGVAMWHDAWRGTCADRVIVATLDRRLIALDARRGKPCAGFGSGGTVDLAVRLYLPNKDFLEFTSPPVIVGDRVILGSSVADNQAVDTPSGAVRAFDVRTGKPLWKWEPLGWVTGAGTAYKRRGKRVGSAGSGCGA